MNLVTAQMNNRLKEHSNLLIGVLPLNKFFLHHAQLEASMEGAKNAIIQVTVQMIKM